MFTDMPILTVLCGPSLVFVVAAIVTTVAAVYSAVTLRAILRGTHYAWGETGGRVTQLERALEAEKERLQALRRVIMRGERTHRVTEVTQPVAAPPVRPPLGFEPPYYR